MRKIIALLSLFIFFLAVPQALFAQDEIINAVIAKRPNNLMFFIIIGLFKFKLQYTTKVFL